MENLLDVVDLKTYFPVASSFFSKKKKVVYAVDGVSFSIKKGETLGLVGESGCGKTTIGRTILRLIEPTEGKALFEGDNIFEYDKKKMKALRRKMQMIFQDPYASLNPRMRVGNIIGEPLAIHHIAGRKERRERVLELLNIVGLKPEHYDSYPHEFSGGQRQRIGIARALALNPDLVIADEPVSSLDVSIQAQIINLLAELKDKFKLTYLFISHDLSLIRYLSENVAVMYLGKIVEMGKSERIYNDPKHPYTKILFSAIPTPDPRVKKKRIIAEGDVPSPIDRPSGCHFHTRCPWMIEPLCREVEPLLKNAGNGVLVSCHLINR